MSGLRASRAGSRLGVGRNGRRPAGAQGQGRTSTSSRTEDMDAVDLDRLKQWASRFPAATQNAQPGDLTTTSHPSLGAVASAATEPPGMKMEAGLRVCPRCAKPLHMSATVCRSCGEPVPRRIAIDTFVRL